jgi:hypothetical protein
MWACKPKYPTVNDTFILPPRPGGDQTLKRRLLKKVRLVFGEVPPHYALLAEIDPALLAGFVDGVLRLIRHKTIHPDYFGFLRLFVARKKNFSYCVEFNTRLLLRRGYDKQTVKAAGLDMDRIPFDERLRLLGRATMKAVFAGNGFTEQDFEELYAAGWSGRDIWDSFDHAATMLKNGPLLAAYLQKD